MSSYRILVVDDCEEQCYAMSRRLQAVGFSISCANSGLDALKSAHNEIPDAVLLDVNLPDISGLEVCSKMRNDPELCRIAIVFHTATHANEHAHQEALMRGADAFLTYPVEIDHLTSVLLGSLHRRKKANPERLGA